MNKVVGILDAEYKDGNYIVAIEFTEYRDGGAVEYFGIAKLVMAPAVFAALKNKIEKLG